MLFYLTLAWNARDLRSASRARALLQEFLSNAPQWRAAIDTEGLAACYWIPEGPNVDEVLILPSNQGVVFGRLFQLNDNWPTREFSDRTNERIKSNRRYTVLDEACASKIVRTGARSLISDYWGQYVAFIRNPQSAQCWIVRDPSGAMPCQRTELDGIGVYFVRLEDRERLGAFAHSINPHYLLGYLAHNSLVVRDTGITEIETILPGEAVELNENGREHRFYWNPLEIANRDVIENPVEAERLLRACVSECVHAWASCFDRLLIFLSGGLDSSIVTACLRDAPNKPHVVCLNEYSFGASADEREFARQAAERAGFDLIEQKRDANSSLNYLRAAPRSPFPLPLQNPDVARQQADLASAYRLTAFFSGIGGDEVFHQNSMLPAAVEYACRHGVDPSLFRIAASDARATGMSVWQVLRAVTRYGLRRRHHPVHIRHVSSLSSRRLLTPQMKDEAATDLSLWHPLYREHSKIPPGKYLQSYGLTSCGARGYTPGFPLDSPVTVLPLLSQPIVELSLRMPQYVLREGGGDRALARKAFGDALPPEIVERTSKGSTQVHMHDVLTRNLSLIRELFLDGMLVREGFVNGAALEALLDKPEDVEPYMIEIFDYLCVEAWARALRATS